MDLFRAAPEYILSLIARAETPFLRGALADLYAARVSGDLGSLMDVMDSLVEELVLENGMGLDGI